MTVFKMFTLVQFATGHELNNVRDRLFEQIAYLNRLRI